MEHRGADAGRMGQQFFQRLGTGDIGKIRGSGLGHPVGLADRNAFIQKHLHHRLRAGGGGGGNRFHLGKIGFREFRVGDQKLQHGFDRAEVLDPPFVDQFQNQAGIELAQQNAGKAGMEQRGKGVPTADVKERESDQNVSESPDNAGGEDIERIPNHLPVRHDADLRHGGGAAGVDVQTDVIQRQRHVHRSGLGLQDDVFKLVWTIIDRDDGLNRRRNRQG